MSWSRRVIVSQYNKYKNVKTVVDGITFDSRHEADRYRELSFLLKTGEIEDLQLQVKYELQPHFRHKGKMIRAINYIADFTYRDKRTGEFIVEDAKGLRTDEYKLKKKMMLYVHGIELKET